MYLCIPKYTFCLDLKSNDNAIYKLLNGVTLFGVIDFAWCVHVCGHVCACVCACSLLGIHGYNGVRAAS